MLKNKTIAEENLEEILSFLKQSLGRFYAINGICGFEGGGQNLKYTPVEKKIYTKSLCFSIMFKNKTIAKEVLDETLLFLNLFLGMRFYANNRFCGV